MDFNCFHCKCFSPVGEKEKSSNHIVSLLILNSSSCCLYYSFLLFILLHILLLQIHHHAFYFTLSCPAGKLIALHFPSLDDVTSPQTEPAIKIYLRFLDSYKPYAKSIAEIGKCGKCPLPVIKSLHMICKCTDKRT